MSLVDIEYHTPCSHYDDGYHRKRSGWYTCECGASSVWHTTKPVEPDGCFYQIDTSRFTDADSTVLNTWLNQGIAKHGAEIGDNDE